MLPAVSQLFSLRKKRERLVEGLVVIAVIIINISIAISYVSTQTSTDRKAGS